MKKLFICVLLFFSVGFSAFSEFYFYEKSEVLKEAEFLDDDYTTLVFMASCDTLDELLDFLKLDSIDRYYCLTKPRYYHELDESDYFIIKCIYDFIAHEFYYEINYFSDFRYLYFIFMSNFIYKY